LWGPYLKPEQTLYGLSPPKLALERNEPETFGGANSKIPSQPLGQLQGSVWISGLRWNGMEWNDISLFGFFKNGWNGMEHDGINTIPFHPLLLFFFPSNLGGMG